MKTFIAVTFIGILTYTCATWVGSNECKNDVKPMEYFDTTKFFNGKWYVTHYKNLTGDSICQTYETSKPTDNKYVVEYKFGNEEQEIKVRCEAGKGEDKILSFICTINGETAFQADYVAMGTDYDDYAVFYRCVTFESSGYQDDNYLLLRRKEGEKEIPECAKRLTSSLGLQECRDPTNSCLK
uniref:Salivary triabin 2 n=1 Tax=Triatoma matogrossensis TaxID=162370 RepID=E2J735_9HEMI